MFIVNNDYIHYRELVYVQNMSYFFLSSSSPLLSSLPFSVSLIFIFIGQWIWTEKHFFSTYHAAFTCRSHCFQSAQYETGWMSWLVLVQPGRRDSEGRAPFHSDPFHSTTLCPLPQVQSAKWQLSEHPFWSAVLGTRLC